MSPGLIQSLGVLLWGATEDNARGNSRDKVKAAPHARFLQRICNYYENYMRIAGRPHVSVKRQPENTINSRRVTQMPCEFFRLRKTCSSYFAHSSHCRLVRTRQIEWEKRKRVKEADTGDTAILAVCNHGMEQSWPVMKLPQSILPAEFSPSWNVDPRKCFLHAKWAKSTALRHSSQAYYTTSFCFLDRHRGGWNNMSFYAWRRRFVDCLE